jgi:hypothetical protein
MICIQCFGYRDGVFKNATDFWYFVGLIIYRYDRGGGGRYDDHRGYVPIGLFLHKQPASSFSRLFVIFIIATGDTVAAEEAAAVATVMEVEEVRVRKHIPQFNTLSLFVFEFGRAVLVGTEN